ncbi:MAG: DUF799 family lipoprotein [Verrucomicrobia bacterium]|nr:DUF799 family lipoprotein [Verrucomicrobiota bacterium]
MNARFFTLGSCCAGLALMVAGCKTAPPPDYTNFRAHHPKSVLVLPPLNQSTAVEATYGYLSTVTLPLAEMGYYVFPVAVIDHFLKENGMPTAGEMHQAPLEKVREIIGADAVLYVTVEQYGTKYQVVNSATVVQAKARLVDVKTGLVLWEGVGVAVESSGGSGSIIGDLIAAAITQAINTSTDRAHKVAIMANANLFTTPKRGLLYGPRHPKFGAPQ